MPQIDVTRLTRSPMIAGSAFQVQRRRQVVNRFGETVTRTTLLDGVGAVYPSGDNSLVRQADYEVQANTITVVTTFRLQGAAAVGSTNYLPDLVIWNGNPYLVSTVNDFSQYGAGFIEAECSSQSMVDNPSPGLPPLYGQLDYTDPAQSSWLGALSC